MVSEVKELISMDVEAIISSPTSLKLLNCYSKLYLNGDQPRGCAASQRNYYRELCLTGITKAMDYEKIKNRTCKPAWNGLMFIHAEARHYNNEYITDEQAITLLERGHLKEKDFIKLPDGYLKNEPIEKSEQVSEVEKPKRGRKPKN